MLKQIIPAEILHMYSSCKEKVVLGREVMRDKKRYYKNAFFLARSESEEGIKSSLIFHSHSIEKGLSHPKFRPNFGRSALGSIRLELDKFLEADLPKDDFSFLNTLSVLKAYKKKHVELEVETPYFDNLFNLLMYKDVNEMAGTTTLQKKGQKLPEGVFEKLATMRHSIRKFSPDPVDMNTIRKAVQMAMSTPSVCNRQPWKIYVTSNSTKIKNILQIQGGYAGYGIPPVLMVVCVDLRDFRGSYERNEPFVDGGLFLMSLLYGLADENMATCVLNAMLSDKNLNSIRKLMNIDSSNVLISFVIAGNYPTRYSVTKSARKPLSSVYYEV